MVEIQAAAELSVQQYVASIGLNPDNVFYQRIRSTNISIQQAQWTIQSPSPHSLLLSQAWVDWKPTITRLGAAGLAEDFLAFAHYTRWKSGLPFTNAMSNIQSTVNSGSQNWTQPRHYAEILTAMFAGRMGSRKCFSSCGGEPDGMEGQQLAAVASRGLATSWTVQDNATIRNENRFGDKLLNVVGGVPPSFLPNKNNFKINCIEPLFCPPFNPYAKLKTGMPDYCWFKHMSPMIPHVRNLEITCNFQNLDAGTMLSRYMSVANGGRLSISALEADLILYWYRPPLTMPMPRELSLNTWWVREHVTQVSAGVAVPNFPAANSTLNGVNTDLIQLASVPTLIVIHAEVDKDSASYSSLPLQSDIDQAGGGARLNPNVNALDTYMEISRLQVLLGDRPQVISTTFTQEELYYLTLKNSKINDFPYSYEQWKGQTQFVGVAAGEASITRGSKCFVALRPKDLSEKFGDGVRFPTSLQFTMSLTARDGVHHIVGGNKIYKLYVHLFSGKHFLTISQDSAEYTEQQVDAGEVGKQQAAALGGALRGNVVLDDSRYHSRVGTI